MAFSSQGKSGNGLYQPLADINVTPLVDVMLVLLIVFMITAPMLASGMKVNLPQAKSAQPLNPKEPVVITVSKDGKLALGADDVLQDHLIETVQGKVEGDKTHIIHIRGDKDAAYGDVVAIMDLLAANGLTHIAIVSDPRAKADKAKTETKPDAPVSAESKPVAPATAEAKP
jgi:biopolymer transport protein ExbD